MRLELNPIPSNASAASAGAKWYFERGRRTLGRAADCDWRLPEDHRFVSKLHCIIERDRDGFILLDKSANGSKVDGVVLHEGETARLSDQSRLELGGLAFAVSISGERARDVEDPEAGIALSDEPLTISAILADISSGGESASGILGERETEAWPILAGDATGPRDRSMRQGAPSSRHVEIGWNGPPQLETATKLLPDDWNMDVSSGFGDHLEHGSATHVAVPIARARAVASVEAVKEDFATSTATTEIEDENFPPLSTGRTDELLETMEALVSQMGEALEAAFQVFDMEPPVLDAEPDLFRLSREDALVSRAQILLMRQHRLTDGLNSLMREAGRMMEPRILEARVDASSSRKLPWGRSRDYWHAYRMQFEKHGRVLSVREVFCAAMVGETSATAAPIAPNRALPASDFGGIAAPEGKEGRRYDEK